VQRQENVKRAPEAASAMGYYKIMIGSQSAGETMPAKRFPTIISPFTFEEELETTKIH